MNIFKDTDFEPYDPPTTAQRNAAALKAQIDAAERVTMAEWAEAVALYEPPGVDADGFLPEPAPPTLKQRLGGWLVRLGLRLAA